MQMQGVALTGLTARRRKHSKQNLIPIVIAPLSRTAAQGENGYRKMARRHITASALETLGIIPVINAAPLTAHRSCFPLRSWEVFNLSSHHFLALKFEESESVDRGVVYNGVVRGVDGV